MSFEERWNDFLEKYGGLIGLIGCIVALVVVFWLAGLVLGEVPPEINVNATVDEVRFEGDIVFGGKTYVMIRINESPALREIEDTLKPIVLSRAWQTLKKGDMLVLSNCHYYSDRGVLLSCDIEKAH